MFDFKLILCGTLVGFMTGLTGIGGGSLMTPVLILFLGISPTTAIGTDLLFASLTKITSVAYYHTKKCVEWRITALLALGSIPAAVITILSLIWLQKSGHYSYAVVNKLIGLIIIITTVFYVLTALPSKSSIQKINSDLENLSYRKKRITILLGSLIGVFVTLTSIGAGILGTTALIIIYPYLKPVQLIATELAHAVPITLLAGIAYIFFGEVDFHLLLNLLIGSIPATYLASMLALKVPRKLMKGLLTFIA